MCSDLQTLSARATVFTRAWDYSQLWGELEERGLRGVGTLIWVLLNIECGERWPRPRFGPIALLTCCSLLLVQGIYGIITSILVQAQASVGLLNYVTLLFDHTRASSGEASF